MTHRCTETDATVIHSVKRRTNTCQACAGTMRTRSALAVPVAFEDLPTAHPHGKRGDRRGARGNAHPRKCFSKAKIARVQKSPADPSRTKQQLLRCEGRKAALRQLKSVAHREAPREQANGSAPSRNPKTTALGTAGSTGEVSLSWPGGHFRRQCWAEVKTVRRARGPRRREWPSERPSKALP